MAWLKRDAVTNDTTLLGLDDKLIISDNNNKFKIMKMFQNRNWRLIINNVQLSDKGHYMCQLSTKPIKYQSAFLDVYIPPTIIDSQTSPNLMQVDEFQKVELRCQAQGYPRPEIEWRKETTTVASNSGGTYEDPSALSYASYNQGQLVSNKSLITLARGDTFVIDRVTRFEAGVYLVSRMNDILE